MDNPIIHTRNLCKSYTRNGAYAVKDLNLEINRGELYGLVGPDGAGKTTTLRMLATIIQPTSGDAWINGADISRQADSIRPQIGYMPQNFSLYPDLNVLENLIFFAQINKVPREMMDARIKAMLQMTHLAPFTHRRAAHLSGGMKKKLALACALIHNPEVVLLDEPSTGVDPVSRRELWSMLIRVVSEGVTVIVSTPYMDEADRCHRVGVLHEGKLLTQGAPDALIQQMPFQIVEVKAKPRKIMRQIVSETPNIIDWRPVGDRLRLAVPDLNSTADKVIKDLNKRMRRENLDVRLLRQTRPSMEDVFVHLVNQPGGHQ